MSRSKLMQVAMDHTLENEAPEHDVPEGEMDPDALAGAEEAEVGDFLDSKYEEAMRLNAALKQMLSEGAKGTGSASRLPPKGPQVERRARAPVPVAPVRTGTAGSRSRMETTGAAGGPAGSRNFTFSSDKVTHIEAGNTRLLQSLTRIDRDGGVLKTREAPARRPDAPSSAAINRRKEVHRINNDNAMFLKRLQNVKPSAGLSRPAKKPATKPKSKTVNLTKPRSAGL